MEEEQKKKKHRWFKNVTGVKRFFLFFGIYFIGFFILLAVSAEYTSRPNFCPTCHYMEPFYNSWKTSTHNKIECVECHFEPGLQGTIKGKMNGLVQIVNYVSTSYKKRKPWADIPDNTCSRSDCHASQSIQDTVYETRGILFNHKHHLSELRRGKKLKCTSCHSQIVQGSHMQVTYNTCFNCHFHKSDDPEHKFDKLTDCKTCHDLDKKSKEQLSTMKYNHTSVVENKIICNSCHNQVIFGDGAVGKDRCFQCHFEDDKLDKYPDTEFMHKTHIAKHSMNCMYCHSPIRHKIQKIDANTPPDCQSCHSGAHSSMVKMYAGETGFNTDNHPSSMYLSGINCKGCHILHETSNKNITTYKSREEACDKCHGKGYGNLIKQWENSSIKRLAVIKSIYNSAKNIVNSSKSEKRKDAIIKLEEAQHNINLVDIGKSVHNIQFADKLLVGSYGLMTEALKLIGATSKLPEFKSSTEYVPNECYNCHGGIQEINAQAFGKTFSHNTHIVKQHIQCDRCHSNNNKHGQLILTQNSCNNCHHRSAKSNESCSSCHGIQTQVYNGNFEGKKTPDIMKEAGVGCIDCHHTSAGIVKPDTKICAKCHDKDYENMGNDWKNDIKSQSGTLNDILSNINKQYENENDVVAARTFLKKINAYKSLYAHNYGLISELLSEKKKAVEKYVK